MYNSQDIVQRIKEKAKENHMSIGELLSLCNLGVNTISKMSKGTDLLTLNFAKIADNLNCSIDYLLGREFCSEQTNALSADESELLDEFRKLDFKGKSSVMQTILNEQERMNSASISKSMKDTIKTVDNFTTVTKPN